MEAPARMPVWVLPEDSSDATVRFVEADKGSAHAIDFLGVTVGQMRDTLQGLSDNDTLLFPALESAKSELNLFTPPTRMKSPL
jgi:hypothetical protein